MIRRSAMVRVRELLQSGRNDRGRLTADDVRLMSDEMPLALLDHTVIERDRQGLATLAIPLPPGCNRGRCRIKERRARIAVATAVRASVESDRARFEKFYRATPQGAGWLGLSIARGFSKRMGWASHCRKSDGGVGALIISCTWR